jgi:hypothetical protein
VKGSGHPQLHGPPRAFLLRLGAALVDGGVLARDHDLPGTVVVRRPHVGDPRTQTLDHLVLEAEDRRHRAGVLARCLGHRQPALAHERNRVVLRERLRRSKRRELAHRVPDDEVRLVALGAQRRENGEARGDESGLLHLRLDELLLRSLEAEPNQVEPGSLAPAAVDLHRLRHRQGDLPAHARLERALAREAECDLLRAHPVPPSVHSIRPEPHVSPAPIPVINTS